MNLNYVIVQYLVVVLQLTTISLYFSHYNYLFTSLHLAKLTAEIQQTQSCAFNVYNSRVDPQGKHYGDISKLPRYRCRSYVTEHTENEFQLLF